MKRIFVPKGTIERHENILTDELVINGRLTVSGIIRANTIVADTLDAEHIYAKKVIANKIFCTTATVSVGIIAKDYVEAQSVKTYRLTAALSKIDQTAPKAFMRIS